MPELLSGTVGRQKREEFGRMGAYTEVYVYFYPVLFTPETPRGLSVWSH